MSLKESRLRLLAVLTDAGIDAYYGTGVFSAPCARIHPAQPWVGPSSLGDGKRTQQWEVWAVAGRVDSGATFDELEALVQDISKAVEPMQGWGRLTWDRPVTAIMGGVSYTACRGTIETREAV